jgi:hypothetical protein
MMILPYPRGAGRAALRFRRLAVALGVLASLASTGTLAQAPTANQGVSAAAPFSDQELEQLVAPFALYPDDLVALILPASTNPLQVVQADRFLDRRKQDPKLELDPKWDDAVKNLLNYPDVVKKMSTELEWTAMLGEAVVADQGEVMEAVQAFRRKTVAAGNLKTDDKQKVVVEKEVVQIVPANPEVIYVPQYNPTTVVVAGGYVPAYYPTPYPVYYYPYAPGAAFATGLIWGAAMGAIWSGGRYNTNWGGGGNNVNIDIDRGDRNVDRGDRNVDRGDRNVDRSRTQNNVGGGDRGGNRGGNSQAWSPNKKPGQVSGSAGISSGKRPGDLRTTGAGGGAGNRAGTQPAGGLGGGGGTAGNRGGGQAGGGGGTAGNRGGGQAGGGAGGARASAQPVGGGAGGGGGGTFDVGSGRQTQMDSARGASSRSASGGGASTRSAPAARPSGGGGGGGARGGGGGGGRGGGGGGRR